MKASTGGAASAAIAPSSASAGAEPDDLLEIQGIGPGYERKLHGAGITSFEQIAHWTEDDIDRIDHELKLKGMPRKEDWREQATELASKKAKLQPTHVPPVEAKHGTEADLRRLRESAPEKARSGTMWEDGAAAFTHPTVPEPPEPVATSVEKRVTPPQVPPTLITKAGPMDPTENTEASRASSTTPKPNVKGPRRRRRLDKNQKYSEVIGLFGGATHMQMYADKPHWFGNDGVEMFVDEAGNLLEGEEDAGIEPEHEITAKTLDLVRWMSGADYSLPMVYRAIRDKYHKNVGTEKEARSFLKEQGMRDRR